MRATRPSRVRATPAHPLALRGADRRTLLRRPGSARVVGRFVPIIACVALLVPGAAAHSYFFGLPVQSGETDYGLPYSLDAPPEGPDTEPIRFFDEDGDTVWDTTEPVYFVHPAHLGVLGPPDIRLLPTARSGLRVLMGDTDQGDVTRALDRVPMYYDRNANAAYGHEDIVYLHRPSAPAQVSVGDVQLSVGDYGPVARVVQTGASDAGLVLSAFSFGRIDYVDSNNDGAPQVTEDVYMAFHMGATVSSGDVRLTRGATPSSPSPPAPSTTPAPSSSSSTAPADTAQPPAPSSTGAAPVFQKSQTIQTQAGGQQAFDIADRASVTVRAGGTGVNMDVTASVSADPGRLPTPPAALKQDGFHGAQYLQFDATVRSGTIERITLTGKLAPIAGAGLTTASQVRFYYFHAGTWRNLEIGQVGDLTVYDKRVDLAAGTVSVDVNHFSAYAVAIEESDARATQVPAPPLTWLTMALAALAGFTLRRRPAT